MIGKLRGRNDLNAMSRRSSSDRVAKLLPAFPFGLLGWRAWDWLPSPSLWVAHAFRKLSTTEIVGRIQSIGSRSVPL